MSPWPSNAFCGRSGRRPGPPPTIRRRRLSRRGRAGPPLDDLFCAVGLEQATWSVGGNGGKRGSQWAGCLLGSDRAAPRAQMVSAIRPCVTSMRISRRPLACPLGPPMGFCMAGTRRPAPRPPHRLRHLVSPNSEKKKQRRTRPPSGRHTLPSPSPRFCRPAVDCRDGAQRSQRVDGVGRRSTAPLIAEAPFAFCVGAAAELGFFARPMGQLPTLPPLPEIPRSGSPALP